MNVYEKLNIARMELQGKELKKSGKNAFSKYPYFELADILPAINQINKDIGITAVVSFTSDSAVMTITNSEKLDEQIIITSPMGSAELKGCHVVQNIGACETYQRRYLYFTAYEITEHDGLEGDTGNPENEKKQKKQPKPEEKPIEDEVAEAARKLAAERESLIKEYTQKIRKLKGDGALDVQAYYANRHDGISIYDAALGAIRTEIKQIDSALKKLDPTV